MRPFFSAGYTITSCCIVRRLARSLLGHHKFKSSARLSPTITLSPRATRCHSYWETFTLAACKHGNLAQYLAWVSRPVLKRHPLFFRDRRRAQSQKTSSRHLYTNMSRGSRLSFTLSTHRLTDARKLGLPVSKSTKSTTRSTSSRRSRRVTFWSLYKQPGIIMSLG